MTSIKRNTLSRRQIFPLLGGVAVIAAAVPHPVVAELSGSTKPGTKGRFVYVGTYTFPGTAPGGTHQSQAKGIYVFKMNPNDGGLTLLQVADIPNPSYLALDPGLRHLYCSTR